MIHAPLQPDRCGSCRWWVRDPGTPPEFWRLRVVPMHLEEAEWGTCQLISPAPNRLPEVPDPVPFEIRRGALARADANGWEVDDYGLSTRSNFGCIHWTPGD